MSNDTPDPNSVAAHLPEFYKDAPPETVLDFDSDEPLVCKRDQSGDTTCESCQ
jgi:hypothetical protein